jgi:hypothetical protein
VKKLRTESFSLCPMSWRIRRYCMCLRSFFFHCTLKMFYFLQPIIRWKVKKFLRWLGVWLLMATVVVGPERRDFGGYVLDRFIGAPFRVNDIMSSDRFEAILTALRFTNQPLPLFRDTFWMVHEMIEAWNENMSLCFRPVWLNCLDESMSTWSNKFTCPGFMFVPRSFGPLVTSITQFVVVFLEFFGASNLLRERIDHANSQDPSLRILVGQLLVCCCVCFSQSTTGSFLLCWILAFVF